MHPTILILLTLTSLLVTSSESARILLLVFPWKSHVFEITSVGQSLLDRGHEVYIVLPPTYPDYEKLQNQSSFKVISYEVKDPDFYMLLPSESDSTSDFIEDLMVMSPIEDMRLHTEGFQEICSNMLSDNALFDNLLDLHFDLAIADASACGRCQLLILYRLQIQYISMITLYEPWLLRIPALPSFVPFVMGYGYDNTERMNFMERLSNIYQLLDWSYDTRVSYLSDDFVRPFFKDKPFRSLNKLAADSKIWLINTDGVIDYARPTMPNEIYIGGLSTKPANALPDDLQKLMDSATQGAIITSFGSFDSLSGTRLQRFLDAFEMLEQLVILRSEHVTDDMQIPKNVKILKWLPQNDLFGHPNTRLFITHGGANGQFEALYHAVPMLGFPIFGDQPYNTRRVAYRGFGLYLNLLDFTSDELYSSIKTILNNKTFYQNIKKASEIFRERPLHPRERAAYWVDQVLEGKVDHLQSYALKMEWYEYLMVDILALGVVILAFLLLSFYILLCYVIPACVRNVVWKGKHKME